ncbi:MAG: radical SAM protein, partial [Aquificaceae bacterium]|nr:radical SAM protein [Aquificaceae bacterium]
SMHPSEIPEELLDLITSEEKIAPHFHLSLQSGSNRILELMERGYKVENYARLVEEITRRRPTTAIGTDIIIGFPSEREEDFLETYRLLRELPIAYMHVFPYSDRPFTKASRMKDKVSHALKEERIGILREMDGKKREDFRRAHIGKELRAVVLEENKLLTENYIELERKGYTSFGKVVKVII